jgi:hypothetical protein
MKLIIVELVYYRDRTARTLEMWVQIPIEAWMYVCICLCCAVLCRWRSCDGRMPPTIEAVTKISQFQKLILNRYRPEGRIHGI